jgi:DNA-binding MarR family transcriptional regulator
MRVKYISLNERIDFRAYRLSLLLARELSKALDKFGLTQEKWQVLSALLESNSSVSQTRISELTLKDKTSVSRLISSMIKAGWVVRTQDKTDGRAYKVRASAKANEKKQEIVDALARQFDSVHTELGPSSRDNLRSLLGKYISILEKR